MVTGDIIGCIVLYYVLYIIELENQSTVDAGADFCCCNDVVDKSIDCMKATLELLATLVTCIEKKKEMSEGKKTTRGCEDGDESFFQRSFLYLFTSKIHSYIHGEVCTKVHLPFFVVKARSWVL